MQSIERSFSAPGTLFLKDESEGNTLASPAGAAVRECSAERVGAQLKWSSSEHLARRSGITYYAFKHPRSAPTLSYLRTRV